MVMALRCCSAEKAVLDFEGIMKFLFIAILFIATNAYSTGTRAISGGSRPYASWNGAVTHVTDGDTVWVQPASGGEAVKVRLEGIDAPEICQPYGDTARAALAGLVLHQTVQVQTRAHDKYGRAVGRIRTANGADVGEWMVAQGHAWTNRYKRFSGLYGTQQQQAQAAGRGLFATAGAQNPADFRKRHGSCHGGGASDGAAHGVARRGMKKRL